MIVQCEKCRTKFKLDDSMVKPGGSKVRCSLCKHVFVASPPEEDPFEEAQTLAVRRDQLEDTLTLESSPLGAAGDLPEEPHPEGVFEEPPEEVGQFEAVSPEDLHELLKEELPEPEPVIPEYREEETGWSDAEPARPREAAKTKTIAKRKSPFLWIILLLFLGLLAAGAAIFFWAPEMVPESLPILRSGEKQDTADLGVRRLSFQEVRGSFVDSEEAGQLFVINGSVQNDYSKTRSFILIKGSILDENGKVVKKKLVYAGNPIADNQLKTMPMEEIERSMKNRYGADRQNVDVQPGTAIPFTIVFEDLPQDLGEFTVEAVRSAPGA
jgi:predicted Zn finger-like uncharacterized protein